ncbi:MAG: head-tail joining protein [Geminicoccaceae bacterium]
MECPALCITASARTMEPGWSRTSARMIFARGEVRGPDDRARPPARHARRARVRRPEGDIRHRRSSLDREHPCRIKGSSFVCTESDVACAAAMVRRAPASSARTGRSARPAGHRTGGEPVTVRVIARRPDAIVGVGETRIHAETATFELRSSEVESPRPGDQLTIGSETFGVRGEPERRDPDRLVWSLDVRRA